jgi:hypothetical protein
MLVENLQQNLFRVQQDKSDISLLQDIKSQELYESRPKLAHDVEIALDSDPMVQALTAKHAHLVQNLRDIITPEERRKCKLLTAGIPRTTDELTAKFKFTTDNIKPLYTQFLKNQTELLSKTIELYTLQVDLQQHRKKKQKNKKLLAEAKRLANEIAFLEKNPRIPDENLQQNLQDSQTSDSPCSPEEAIIRLFPKKSSTLFQNCC